MSRYRVSIDGDDGRASVLATRNWAAAWHHYAVLCAWRPAARVALTTRDDSGVWRVMLERPAIVPLGPRPGRANV